jgi:hypothetical protein
LNLYVQRWSTAQETGHGMSGATAKAIMSECCVVMDANTIAVLGATEAMLLRVSAGSSNSVRVVSRIAIPDWWSGTSPGITGVYVAQRGSTALFFNLYPKQVSRVIAITFGDPALGLLHLGAISTGHMEQINDGVFAGALCHRPPLSPIPAMSVVGQVQGVYLSSEGRWSEWNGDERTFFALPMDKTPSSSSSSTSSSSSHQPFHTQPHQHQQNHHEQHIAPPSDFVMTSVLSSAGEPERRAFDDEEDEEQMPLLVEVKEQRVSTVSFAILHFELCFLF